MATTNFSKISGVIRVIPSGSTNPTKSYYNHAYSYQQTPDGAGFYIYLGSDVYQVALTDLQVNGQSPTSMTEASVLLNSLIGT